MSKKYILNENYFDSINTERKAYFLGLIYADGNVSQKGVFKLTLALKDKTVIEELGKDLYINNDAPIKKIAVITKEKQYPCVSLSINRQALTRGLVSQGVIPAKSFVLTFPTKLDNDVLPHFIRGYFDGDGGFSYYFRNKGRSLRANLSFIGSISFIEKLQSVLAKECDIRQRKSYPKGKMRYILVGANNEISRCFNYLYNNASIWLPRKKDKMMDYFSIRRSLPLTYVQVQ